MDRANPRLSAVLAHFSGRRIDDPLVSHPTYEFIRVTLPCDGTAHHYLAACRVPLTELFRRGCPSPAALRPLGYGSFHLLEPLFFSLLRERASLDELRAWVVTAGDAIVVAGSEVSDQLGFTPVELLKMCLGVPSAANAVVEALLRRHLFHHVSGPFRTASPLAQLPGRLLVDAGVNLATLPSMHYEFYNDIDALELTPDEMASIGMPCIGSLLRF